MADNEIRFVGDLSRLEWREGDKFILMVEGPLTANAHARIQHAWKEFVGGDAEKLKLLIIDHGMKLGLLNTSAAQGESS